MSKRREKLMVERRKIVAEMTGKDQKCVACIIVARADNEARYIQRTAQDVHEIVNRSQGGSIIDRRNLLAVCRPCHTWITDNPQAARDTGLSLYSYQNDDVGFEEAAEKREFWSC